VVVRERATESPHRPVQSQRPGPNPRSPERAEGAEGYRDHHAPVLLQSPTLSVHTCLDATVELLRKAGADTEITEYAGASHEFERRGPPRPSSSEQNASHCFWQERPEGQLVSGDGGLPFSVTDPCVVLGGSYAFDPAAYRDAPGGEGSRRQVDPAGSRRSRRTPLVTRAGNARS